VPGIARSARIRTARGPIRGIRSHWRHAVHGDRRERSRWTA